MTFLFTSESVSAGHPDKVCDQISDALLDIFLTHDVNSRVAIETVASGTQIHVVGEVRSNYELTAAEAEAVVRTKLAEIGYNAESYGADFSDPAAVSVNIAINKQSPDIAHGVESSLELRSGLAQDNYDNLGAGDQGIVFGHASNELSALTSQANKSFLPAPIFLAHQLAINFAQLKKHHAVLGPDAKTQVTLEYDAPGKPVAINTVLISAQHSADIIQEELQELISTQLIDQTFADLGINADAARKIINPSGRFIIGGPMGDAGLTGRKIVVDTYGGAAPHGGGAFSGKDPSKVDRSAAYAARWVAKNLVAAGLVNRVTVQIAYAIGAARPVSVFVQSDIPEMDAKLSQIIQEKFDLRPAAIIERLGLNTFTNYQQTAAFGHFGRTDISLPWEEIINI